MELYFSLVDMILSANSIKVIKKEENELWFLNKDQLISIEQHDYTYKKEWLNNIKRFVQDVNLHFKHKLRPKKLIRISVTDANMYDLIDHDYNVFKNEFLTSYIVNKNTKLQQLTDVIAELFSVQSNNVNVVTQKIHDTKIDYVRNKPFVSKRNTSYVTYALVLTMILSVLLLQRFNFDAIRLIDVGAKFNYGILNGEYYRFIFAGFLHLGWFHLLTNMIVLFFVGKDIEKYFGKMRYIVIFLVSMIFGNVASFAFSTQISVGASGGIFGLYGALLYMSYFYKDTFSSKYMRMIMVFIGINIATGFFMSEVDQVAHIIGFCSGFIVSVILSFPKEKLKLNRLYLIGVLLISFIGLLVFGFVTNKDNSSNYMYAGEYYLQKKNYGQAEDAFSEAISKSNSSTEIALKLGRVEYALNNYNEAEKNLLVATDPEVFYFLAKNAYAAKDRTKALKYVSIALFLDPENEKYLAFKNKLQKTV